MVVAGRMVGRLEEGWASWWVVVGLVVVGAGGGLRCWTARSCMLQRYKQGVVPISHRYVSDLISTSFTKDGAPCLVQLRKSFAERCREGGPAWLARRLVNEAGHV